MNTTYTPSAAALTPKWYLVDAKDQCLGRLATTVARLIRGKDKPIYTPFLDTGDVVVVINAEHVAVTGKKRSQKLYRRHSGRPGGMKTETFAQLQQRIPERIVEEAVRGMLPKNRLGRQLFTKLHVYTGPNHPHAAQQPQPVTLDPKANLGGQA
ncbi:MAG: 50S ribosomal protein L13 [Gloeomargaritaceae cyanobacterium C42_A2020_066]|nr:50S ribosomal protein L13 [Gloeomargaritaceae cyanobacterium C42_A2020_066]